MNYLHRFSTNLLKDTDTRRSQERFVSIWSVCNPGFVYNDGADVRCIWGSTTQKQEYYAPINSTKVGKQVDIRDTTPYTAMQLNLNPLEHALYTAS